ncbi:MAG: hypothetical protein R8K22_04935 [Mariprofundaceae bacterium]
MNSLQENTHSLFIGRHAAQLILRSAMVANPEQSVGLIGMRQEQYVEYAASTQDQMPTTNICIFNPEKVNHILDHWDTENIIFCGTFTSSPTQEEPDFQSLESLKKIIPLNHKTPTFHLFTSLNTKGCLETFAYQLINEQYVQVPLLLTEDGQQPLSG